MKFIQIFLIFLTAGSTVFAEQTKDSGKITHIYSAPSGSFAFKLDNGRTGIPQAVTKHNCTTGGGWIGSDTTNPSFISSVLAAKMAGLDVDVYISECNNTWFKPAAIYVNE